MDYAKAFGLAIREARLERKLTQEQLAEIAKLHPNFVSLVERGRTQPALDSIFSLSAALEKSAVELMKRTVEISSQ